MAWLLDWLLKNPLVYTLESSDFKVLMSNDEAGQRAEDSFPTAQPKSHLGVFIFGHKICVVRGGLVVGIPSCPGEKAMSTLCLH